ncbi:MAG: hypothetical protein K2I64_05175 [Muribaculaceae bacterium]|nr:hypothetical protein [Muribaculaceae bacterium]
MYRKVLLLFTLTLLSVVTVSAQTSFYKRSKIVKQGNVKTCSDDGHYITFGDNCAYDSDRNGYQLFGSNMKYSKTENNIKVYYGTDYHGSCNWFVALDNSRINVKIPDGTIYVYERCTPGANIAMRAAPATPPGGNYPPAVVPSTPSQSHDTPGGTSPSSSHKQRRTCPYCKGTGIGMDKITYAPGYDEVYCEKCGKRGFKHYHQNTVCRTCYGRGYIEY